MKSELSKKLKDADYKLWNEYRQWQQHDNIYDATALEFILQGCIQRACERRGWGYTLSNLCNNGRVICRIDTYDENKSVEYANSPAEALLTAYIIAIKKENNKKEQ